MRWLRALRALAMTMGTTALIAGCARAQIIPTPPPPAVEPGVAPLPGQPVTIAPALQNIPLGEELEYSISWWGIPVGTVALTAAPAQKEDPDAQQLPPLRRGAQPYTKLDLRGWSNDYLRFFYPVHVRLVSFLDPESRAPLKFQASVKRRWRTHDSIVTFDQQKQTAFHRLPKGRSATIPIHSTTQDGLSVVYYARTLDFRVGQEIPLEITADGKNWNLKGTILRTGKITLRGFGTQPVVEGHVELAYPVPFFQGARARIWFSADGDRIPLLAKIHSRIGPATVVLVRRSLKKV